MFIFCVFVSVSFDAFRRGNCGHLKAKWDNHPSCLSCTTCTHISPCSVCSSWTDKVWILAEKRRLYASRKSVMTQRWKQKKSKKILKSQSDLSAGLLMQAPPLKAILLGQDPSRWQPGGLRVRPGIKSTIHQSTRHPVTGQQITSQPVTGQFFTGHPVTGHPVVGQPVTGHPVTSQPVTSQPGTSQPGSSQPGISYQSFAYDLQTQFVPGYLPGSVPVQNYAPSISSHVSNGSGRRLSNVHTPGYEHSESPAFPNPATSSKQFIPLKPDFSQISDPSVMIDLPDSTDISQTRPSWKEKSTRDHKSKKRRRHRSSSSSTSTSRSDSLSSSRRKKKSKRSKHSHREEEVDDAFFFIKFFPISTWHW